LTWLVKIAEPGNVGESRLKYTSLREGVSAVNCVGRRDIQGEVSQSYATVIHASVYSGTGRDASSLVRDDLGIRGFPARVATGLVNAKVW